MIRSVYLLFASGVLLLACTHQASVVPQARAEYRVKIHEDGIPAPAGTRLAIQFNNEPAIVQVADGRGGPPILYHGKDLNPDSVKSIRILRTKEARERFEDQTLDAAILIELK
jgi:hypothetical protein